MKDKTIESILIKAAKKENELYLLYKNAEKCVKNTRIKTILKKLAREEMEHKQFIINFKIDRLKKGEIRINKIPQQLISKYLTSKSLSDFSDFEDVLIYICGTEKTASEFYSNISKCIDSPDLKKLFIWLAREKSRHREDIENLFWEVVY